MDNLVYTVRDRCRVCYTCVRECPAKAIRIANGQAEVIPGRCIACGNCTEVCSQKAKTYQSSINQVFELLDSGKKVIACLGPSFPAEFEKYEAEVLVGMIKALGFYKVTEVAFGADLVIDKYRELFSKDDGNFYITANCPAIVSYIRKYHSKITDKIAPVISPLIAMSRVLRELNGDDIFVVFIGPCIAKKVESNEVDEALTYPEIREMFRMRNITNENVEPQPFDEPVGGRGALFPLSRGMVQAAAFEDGDEEGNILVAEGYEYFIEVLREVESGFITDKHLELLCCEGCISGPGMSTHTKRFARKLKVGEYVKKKLQNFDEQKHEDYFQQFRKMDMSRTFRPDNLQYTVPPKSEINRVLLSMDKNSLKDHLDCKACGYDTCVEHAMAICMGLAEPEMCLPYAISKLHKSVKALEVTNKELADVQKALRQSEKLASMGQLSAGIAHELNNPLGIVIMYANILLEEAQNSSAIKPDLELIVQQAERCKSIVGGLLNFARKNQVRYNEVNIRLLVQRSLNSLVIPDNVEIEVNENTKDFLVNLDSEQITQVMNNLVKNSIEAMSNGGKIKINIGGTSSTLMIEVSDNGPGIAPENQEKVFEPFFTTKGIGKGTGLGLATTYGIVKMHKGKINLQSNTDKNKGETGTKFLIELPRGNN